LYSKVEITQFYPFHSQKSPNQENAAYLHIADILYTKHYCIYTFYEYRPTLYYWGTKHPY